MVIIIAGDHRLHVQNVYLFHIVCMSRLRYSTVVIALRSISLTYYKTTVVSQPNMIAVYNPEESYFFMFCVIVQDISSLLISTCSTKENVMTVILLTLT